MGEHKLNRTTTAPAKGKPGIFGPNARLWFYGVVVLIGVGLMFCGGCDSQAPAAAPDAGVGGEGGGSPPHLGSTQHDAGGPAVDTFPAAVEDAGRAPVDGLWTSAPDSRAGEAGACPPTCDTQGEAVRCCLCPVGDGTFTCCTSIAPAKAFGHTCCGVACP